FDVDILWNQRTSAGFINVSGPSTNKDEVKTGLAQGTWNIPLSPDWRLALGGSYGMQDVDDQSFTAGTRNTPIDVKVHQADFDARLGGALSLGARQVKMSLGAGGSTQHLSTSGDEPAHRKSQFATAELATNLLENAGRIDNIALSLAGRYDHYSDFGG